VAIGQIKRAVPRLSLPLRLEGEGLATIEQDSIEDVAQGVFATLAYERGARLEDPLFGIDDPTFDVLPLDISQWLSQIERYEPRAEVQTREEIGDLFDLLEVAVSRR
jgi:hypothetical protein